MPNWIKGNMKIRGAEKDVYRFMTDAFEYWNRSLTKDENGNEYYKHTIDPTKIIDSDYGDYCHEVEIANGCHLKKSRRAFVNGEAYCYFGDITSSKEKTACIDFKQAWGFIDEIFYKELSEKYNIDIRLIGWERGMEYKATMEVIRGTEPEYTEYEYDDWFWETECPNLGG